MTLIFLRVRTVCITAWQPMPTAQPVGGATVTQWFFGVQRTFRFSSNGNFAVYNLGTDLDVVFTGASVSNGVNTYSLPSQVSHNLTTSAIGPRHGSVVKITSEQYTELKSVAFSTELPADSSLSTPTQPADRNNGIDLFNPGYYSFFLCKYFRQ